MAFLNHNLHFPDVPTLARWLLTCPPPSGWRPRKVTYHNTYKPTQADWNGKATMRGMATYYEQTNGWDRGPHFYLATGTRADGIFVMTPPWLSGIHAGSCNSVAWGIENVGDYQTRPMSEAQIELLVGVSAALFTWQRLPAELDAHRDCMAGRTCPGNAAYAQKGEIQRRLTMTLNTTRLEPDRPPVPIDAYSEYSPILGSPRATLDQAVSLIVARPHGEYTDYDVRVIVGAYWQTCSAVGVDPVLAVSQMCHETGYLSSQWAARPRRNGCGFGVTGFSVSRAEYERNPAAYPDSAWTWSDDGRTRLQGASFSSWLDINGQRGSISAHIGRLIAYAVLPVDQTPEQAALATYALGLRSLPSTYWGAAPKLKDLDGKWAYPGVGYGAKIATIANAIIARPIAEKRLP